MLKESSNVLKDIKKYSSKNLLANKHSEHFESIAKIWDHLNFNHLISKWSELSITGLEVRFAAFPSSSLGRGFGGCGKSCLHQSSDSESPEGYAAQFTVRWTGNWKLKSFTVDKSLKTTCNNLIGWLILYIWPSLFFYGKTKIICYCCTQNYFNISMYILYSDKKGLCYSFYWFLWQLRLSEANAVRVFTDNSNLGQVTCVEGVPWPTSWPVHHRLHHCWLPDRYVQMEDALYRASHDFLFIVCVLGKRCCLNDSVFSCKQGAKVNSFYACRLTCKL